MHRLVRRAVVQVRGVRGPLSLAVLLRRILWRCWGYGARLELDHVGSGTLISPSTLFLGSRRVSIGERCLIAQLCRVTTEESGEIVIGDGVVIGNDVVLSASRRLTIGSRVILGNGCFVSTHQHRTDQAGAVGGGGYDGWADVSIGEGAWLASHVVVQPGVTIGAGAVIGANSVVTRDVPARTVAVGAPARAIRER